jgi:hypothetical protein
VTSDLSKEPAVEQSAELGIITVQLGVTSQYVNADHELSDDEREIRRAPAVLTVQALDTLPVSQIVDHCTRSDGHVARCSPEPPTWVWSDDELVSATLARHYGIEQKADRQDEAAMTAEPAHDQEGSP